jgi:Flp pilus assembly protein TadG
MTPSGQVCARFGLRFLRDRRGVSAIEFAFIAPILIVFYFGMAEVCSLLMAKRKISHAGAAVADLVSQEQSAVTPQRLNDIASVGDTIVHPLSVTPLKIQLTSVTSRAPAGGTTPARLVDWSHGDGTARQRNSIFNVATPLNAGESVIVAEVSYSYTSSIGYFIQGARALSHKAELRPRKQDQIACATCP